MKLKVLVGSGRKIGIFMLPYIVVGLALNILKPAVFSIGGPSTLLRAISYFILFFGMVNWIWSVVLILTKIPKKELITVGPYTLVKHPLYVGMAILVLPWAGFLLNSWLGIFLGVMLYLATRKYAPEEESILAGIFGRAWEDYLQKVILPWL